MGKERNAGSKCKVRPSLGSGSARQDKRSKDLLKAAIAQFNLSGHGYNRILKVSRTIAELEDAQSIEMLHVAEAINYRAFDRKLFG